MMQRARKQRTADERRSIKAGALIGIGIAVLVMVPAVYRLLAEPFRWVDAALVAAGVGLVTVHIVRLVRLRTAP
ncbi:hypothetical protein [Arthrobacter sp. EPSL27]|uniref:hypothetical protein n=1 Tax=Arthrobacter sp. EPSL27 TaxID=1745378 RepID=UPI000A852BA1|nr:hypothetical protein [Arthrobacter sp. EPSL27]